MALTRFERFLSSVLRGVVRMLFAFFQLFAPRGGPDGSKRLPPITNPLLRVPAMRLAQMIRRREVSSVEVVQAYIDRIQDINPLINAMVKDRFSQALQEAAQVDRLVDEETGGGAGEEVLEDKLPLLGVPFTVKEAFTLQGMPNSTGLVSRRGMVSGTDAPPVALLKRAGAIPLGVTNCSELCMWLESHNRLYGVTNNPYALERIPGGSSGGEGSILGGGGSVIGVGSDVGGSIRMPAFFNGIFGHKPTPGVVSNEGQFPPASGLQPGFLCTGPMCRYAQDLLPMLRVMAGLNADRLNLSSEVDLKKLRFFSVPHDGGSPLVSPVDPQLIQAQNRVVERLEADLGVKVEQLKIPQLKYSFQIWGAMMAAPGKDGKLPIMFAELMANQGKRVWPVWEMAKWILGFSKHTMAAIGLATVEMFQPTQPSQFILQQRESLQKDLEELLGTDGVLLYPSHPHLAPRHHHPLFTPFNFSYTGIFNILGLPVTQCPLGLSTEGLPLGVQLVMGKMQDHLGLAMAVYLEQAFGGWRDPAEASPSA
ncbi:fatty-acid amide hydrolase 2-A-like isoform X1 [Hypomesus transpacificus]|uniref:fatty-acid amide hydrolase 2-A-like isoform X1 n=1 Tax=Hypomesus transpacificus TaxID=137520 RepID=UPI001F087254|nr:fatty-acid amide hydrolase 2-A-like isoform X1 [Hypomesus transpacificus]